MAIVELGVCFKYDKDLKKASFIFLNSSCQPVTFGLATESPATFTLKKGAPTQCTPQFPCGVDFDFRSLTLILAGLECTVTAGSLPITLPIADVSIKFDVFNDDEVTFTAIFTSPVLIGMVVTVEDTVESGLPFFTSRDPQIVLEPQPPN